MIIPFETGVYKKKYHMDISFDLLNLKKKKDSNIRNLFTDQ